MAKSPLQIHVKESQRLSQAESILAGAAAIAPRADSGFGKANR
jgi:hypothetical protein